MHKIKSGFEVLLLFSLLVLIFLLTCFSQDAKEGSKSGIELCENVIIPSLLPIIIICSVITKSRLSLVFEKLFGRLFEKVFRLPRVCASAVILGLIGGYPSGAVLTYSLYKSEKIDEKEAERIMKFNFCSGIAFTVTAVGTVVYSSTKTGLIIYLINIISSLIIAFFTRFQKAEKKRKYVLLYEYKRISDALCDGVEDTVKALAVMSAYIILFSSVFQIINPPEFLIPLLEITNGVCGETSLPPDFVCFFLAFGGLCIHFQLFGLLRKMKVKYKTFLISRIEGAIISFFLYKLYALIFPEANSVFNNISSPARSFSSGALTLSILMIIGCAVVIFDIENRKLKLHTLL